MGKEIVLSERTVKKVNKFVKQLSTQIKEKKEVVKDFQEEMSINIKSSIIEFRREGYGEEEAFSLAINRFGNRVQIGQELKKVFTVEKRAASNLFKGAMLFLVIFFMSVITFTISKIIADKRYAERNKEIFTTIEEQLKKDETIPDREIIHLYEKHKNVINYIAIINVATPNFEFKNVEYVYPTATSFKEIRGGTTFSIEKVIGTPKHTFRITYGTNKEISTIPFERPLKYIGFISFILYWMTFGVWGMMKTQTSNGFNIPWVILFFTLNIVALFLFIFDKNRFQQVEAV